MKKILIILIGIALLGAVIYGYYQYNKPVSSLTNQQPDYSVTAYDFFKEYQLDEDKSNTKYLGKIIEVRGTIAEISTNETGTVSVNLETGDLFTVSCQMAADQKSKVGALSKNGKVAVKGICTGILMDVVLINCVISE